MGADIFPARVMVVKYESLVSEPEVMLSNILEFCKLKWQAECLDFYRSEAVVHTASANQVRNKLYITSMENWKKYESFLPESILELGHGY